MISGKLTKAVINKIVTGFKPEKIVIFGSQARSDRQVNSDIDIAVAGINAAQAGEIREILNEELETLLDFDVVSLDDLRNEALKKSIQDEGVVIYERNAE
ncbi:MAG: nucleotidyltransferase domain-containing protein [bacterium]